MLRAYRIFLSTAMVATFSLLLPGLVGAASAQSPAMNAWRPLSSLPVPSAGLTATLLDNGSVLAMGGDPVLGAHTRLVARFDLRTSNWQRLPDAPVPLDTPALLPLTLHAVLVVAPSFANGTIAAPSKALLLDPGTGAWTVLPPCPVPLFGPRLVRIDSHQILAAGGLGASIGAIFDQTTRRWRVVTSPVANLAGYTVAGLPGGGAFLLGGVAINARQQPYAVKRAFILDEQGTWREVARPPIVEDGAQAVALDDHQLLLAGGYPLADDPRLPAPPAMLYDVAHNHWMVVGFTGADHRGAQLLSLGPGGALLVGGHGPNGQPTRTSLHFDGTRWEPVAMLPEAWSRYALVALTDGSVMLIGGDRALGDNFVPVADTLLLPIGAAQG
jgi:hypothetical protein